MMFSKVNIYIVCFRLFVPHVFFFNQNHADPVFERADLHSDEWVNENLG